MTYTQDLTLDGSRRYRDSRGRFVSYVTVAKAQINALYALTSSVTAATTDRGEWTRARVSSSMVRATRSAAVLHGKVGAPIKPRETAAERRARVNAEKFGLTRGRS